MGNIFSPAHLIVILLLILVLFGRGKISELMADVAKGIKAFKKSMKEEEEGVEGSVEKAAPSQVIDGTSQPSQPLSVKHTATRRKASSHSKGGKASITKKQRIK